MLVLHFAVNYFITLLVTSKIMYHQTTRKPFNVINVQKSLNLYNCR